MNQFTITTRADGACVINGPGGGYVAVRGPRLADAIRHACERAYRRGALDAVNAGDTLCGALALLPEPAPAVPVPVVEPADEAPAAVEAIVTLGIRKADAAKLLNRVREREPHLRDAGDLLRAMLALRAPAPF